MRIWRVELGTKGGEYAAWTLETAVHRLLLDLKEERGAGVPPKGEKQEFGPLSVTYVDVEAQPEEGASKPKKVKKASKTESKQDNPASAK